VHGRSRPEAVAALVNASLVFLIPVGLAFILMMGDDDVVRPSASSLFKIRDALVIAALCAAASAPFALLSGWRTWVHAKKFLEGRSSGWVGVMEAGGLSFGVALVGLANGILRRPHDAPPYIVFYGGVAAIFGLLLGVLLRSIALWVLKRA
jgi:hypothetical protein